MSDAEQQDRISALEHKIRNLIQETIDNFRGQVEARLEEQSETLRRLTERVQVELPDAVFEEEDLPQLAPEPAAAEGAVSVELLEAVRDLDRARTQEDLIDSLIRGAQRFASRAALFLLRPGEIRGWRGVGFADSARDLDEVSFGPQLPEGWDRVAEARGWTRLEPNQCGHLCSRLEAPLPQEGLLVPLVLQDRVAAALYADRLGDGDRLDVAALQILTHLASLSLETLSARRRAATPTLWSPDQAPADVEALPLWAPQPATEPEPAPPERVEPEPMEPEPATLEPEPARAEPSVPALEPEPAEAPELQPPAGEQPEQIEPPTGIPVETVKLDSPAEVEEQPASDYWRLEDEPATPDLEDTSDERLLDVGEEREKEASGLPEAAGPAGLEASPAEAEATDLDSTHPGEPSAVPEARDEEEEGDPAEAPRRQPEPPDLAARSTTEVAPPPDMTGPGRAVARSADESAAHEEAKRLARLLVSEIKLYNEEEVQEGRRKGDLYQRLRDDIDRSREMYEERIDPGVRGSEDHFHRELIRILADGNEETLGMSEAD